MFFPAGGNSAYESMGGDHSTAGHRIDLKGRMLLALGSGKNVDQQLLQSKLVHNAFFFGCIIQIMLTDDLASRLLSFKSSVECII